jgi:hypothetical protein
MIQALAALGILLSASAQEGPPDFSGAGWVNSPGLSLERIKGKVVFLYFFEEG